MSDEQGRQPVDVTRPWLYLRSPSGLLHLRRRPWSDEEFGGPGNGLSVDYARCGWDNDLGSVRIPARLIPDGEYLLCKRCAVIEP